MIYGDLHTTLFNEDCRKLSELIKNDWFGDRPIAIITDPPYGRGAKTLWNDLGRYGKGRPKMKGNDEQFDPRWILDLSVPTLLFGANHYCDKLPPSTCWVVWDRRGTHRPGQQPLPEFDQSDCEIAWTNFPGSARIVTCQWAGFIRGERTEPRIHPTQKPVSVMRWIITRFIPPGTLIIDPYAGSCSTLRAAKDLRYPSVGFEIDTAMCEKAIPRLAQEPLPIEMPNEPPAPPIAQPLWE